MKEGIKKVMGKFWRAVTPEYLISLRESMPSRMPVVNAAGGPRQVPVYHHGRTFHQFFKINELACRVPHFYRLDSI